MKNTDQLMDEAIKHVDFISDRIHPNLSTQNRVNLIIAYMGSATEEQRLKVMEDNNISTCRIAAALEKMAILMSD